MHRILWSACLLLAAWPSAAAAPDDAVTVDPTGHRLLIDNEFVRVFDARASAGTRSPMHTHPPMTLVSIAKARFQLTLPDGKQQILDLNPGQVLWVPGARHSWELLAGDLQAIGVEIKSAQKPEPPPQPTEEQRRGDAVSVDPAVHHVLFENPHVRVFEGRASHGATSPMHRHPPSLIVSLDWLRMRFTQPDGTSAIFDFSPSQVLWMGEGAEHSWQALAGNGRVIVIEVKAAQAARAQ